MFIRTVARCTKGRVYVVSVGRLKMQDQIMQEQRRRQMRYDKMNDRFAREGGNVRPEMHDRKLYDQFAVMLILVLVLKDSLRTKFKSLSLSLQV